MEVPDGAGVTVLEGRQPERVTYEPFGPSSFHSLGFIDLKSPTTGTYLAVYGQDKGGHYGVTVGYVEIFSVQKRITTPIRLVSVYHCSGECLALIFAPVAAVIFLGLFLIGKRLLDLDAPGRLGSLAGLLFLATGGVDPLSDGPLLDLGAGVLRGYDHPGAGVRPDHSRLCPPWPSP